MNYRELAEKTESYIIEQRRWFHKYPELSFEEFKTTEHIIDELKKMGYTEFTTFPINTGVTTVLKGGRATESSPTVALRADIDALAVNEKTGLPFASVNEGVMHACGHDCHASMLLGAAKMLMETKDELKGNVKLIFQPSEENGEGARYLMDQGVLDGVDALMGQHVWATLPEPYINIQEGPRMASMDRFTITVEGVSAHGTQPHMGVDALLAASAIVTNVQAFVSRMNDPLNPFVLHIGEMHAGTGYNIIAKQAVLIGTTRTYDPVFRDTVEDTLRRICERTAEVFGATATLEFKRYASGLFNDDDLLTKIAREAAVKLYGEEILMPLKQMMSSEDFAEYCTDVPAVFAYLGSGNEELGMVYGNHHDCYTVNEPILKRGAALMAQFAADYLEQS